MAFSGINKENIMSENARLRRVIKADEHPDREAIKAFSSERYGIMVALQALYYREEVHHG
tara:strand:+ start:748 stop:927 length:180 start_codon:yes stop_codon:yes gene_type:complete